MRLRCRIGGVCPKMELESVVAIKQRVCNFFRNLNGFGPRHRLFSDDRSVLDVFPARCGPYTIIFAFTSRNGDQYIIPATRRTCAKMRSWQRGTPNCASYPHGLTNRSLHIEAQYTWLKQCGTDHCQRSHPSAQSDGVIGGCDPSACTQSRS
jgi:hypothetical protein